MKAKAQEMATVNAGLIQSNSQLTSRVKLLESMQNPFNHPAYQRHDAWQRPIVRTGNDIPAADAAELNNRVNRYSELGS